MIINFGNGISPHIGENGNWFIGPVDTNVKAVGTNAITPHIGNNGNWFIGDSDTGVRAYGQDGTNGRRAFLLDLTLTADGWSENTQTIMNESLFATGWYYTINPKYDNQDEYNTASIYADSITTDGQITFHCETVPEVDIGVNILVLELERDLSVKLEAIAITNLPNKVEYSEGDEFDTTGMVVTAYYSDDTHDDITSYIYLPKEMNLGDTAVTITYTWRGVTVSAEVPVTIYERCDVFGVMWDYSNPSTALTRLTSENDPHGFVNTNINEEPVPALGASYGFSPFDNYLPWSGMEEYNIIGNEVKYKKGDTEFSRTLYDTMVYIPTFYYKVIDDPDNSKRYWYISNGSKEGFELHPGSNKYVGRYKSSSDYKSMSATATLNKYDDRAECRSNILNKGNNWGLLDYATHCALLLLYLVEFSNWDSQSMIGLGYNNGSNYTANTGSTDTMLYHTGTIASDRSSNNFIQYRNIENLWGQIQTILDGLNMYNFEIFISTDRGSYVDESTDNYIRSNIILSEINSWKYITGFYYNDIFPWSFIPSSYNGSDSTYIADGVQFHSGWSWPQVAGYSGTPKAAGLFEIIIQPGKSITPSNPRLMYHPD